MNRPSYATAVLCLSAPHAPHPYAQDPGLDGIFDDIGHAVSGVAKAVAHVAKDVGEAVGKAAIAPAIFVKDMGDAVLHGERIDRALLRAGEKQMKIFKDAAVFAQIGLSFIPGIGQSLSAAIGAGLALAEGKKLTDALIAGIKGAIPGGPLVGAAFDMGARAVVGVAEGKRLDVVALEAVRNNIPGGDAARLAFDTGLALAQGKKLQEVVLSAAGTLVDKVAGSIHLPEGVTRIGQAAEKLLPTTALAHGAYEMTRRALAGKPLAGSTRAALLRHATRVPAAARPRLTRPARVVRAPSATPSAVAKVSRRSVRPSYATTSTEPYAPVRQGELGALGDLDSACCATCDMSALDGFEDFLPALGRGIASAVGPLVQRAAGAAVGAATNAATSLLTSKPATLRPTAPQGAGPRRALSPTHVAPPRPQPILSPHRPELAPASARSAVPYVVGGVAILAAAGGGALLWRHHHQRAAADADATRATSRGPRGRNAR